MASAAIFVGTVKTVVAQAATANTGRDGSGTIVDVYTPGASGGRVDRVLVEATGTTTAGVIRLWLHNGSAYRLIEEILVSAITPSTSVKAFSAESARITLTTPLQIPTGYKLAASTHVAETFNVVAICGDY